MSSHSSPSEIERKVDTKPPRPHRTPEERLDEVHHGGEENEVIDLCSSPTKPKIKREEVIWVLSEYGKEQEEVKQQPANVAPAGEPPRRSRWLISKQPYREMDDEDDHEEDKKRVKRIKRRHSSPVAGPSQPRQPSIKSEDEEKKPNIKKLKEKERGLKCANCSKGSSRKFKTLTALAAHTRDKHGGRMEMPCEFCERKFYGDKELLNHHKQNHSGQGRTPSPLPQAVEGVTCSLCPGRTFKNFNGLSSHRFAKHPDSWGFVPLDDILTFKERRQGERRNRFYCPVCHVTNDLSLIVIRNHAQLCKSIKREAKMGHRDNSAVDLGGLFGGHPSDQSMDAGDDEEPLPFRKPRLPTPERDAEEHYVGAMLDEQGKGAMSALQRSWE